MSLAKWTPTVNIRLPGGFLGHPGVLRAAIVQLYHGKYKLQFDEMVRMFAWYQSNLLSTIFTMLAYNTETTVRGKIYHSSDTLS